MPRVSIVVPIYNVETYLPACLESVLAQTIDDYEVVMVDDGSTDSSGEIAAGYAARDPRFKHVTRPNGGLSAARNTGIDAATGEFLAFLDSDDIVPPDAYERLLGALDQTGSDFASGNVMRLSGGRRMPARFLTRAFAETRLKTHVTRHRALLADRIAWNKLWRRSFWDANAFRFPEGRIHEDIPITIPAHFMAKSVDVLAEPVYLWRMREGGELSITQRRLEMKALNDRVAAIDDVRAYLAKHKNRRARRWYDQSVVADDLKLHLNVLDAADDVYRDRFLEWAVPFLESAGKDIEHDVPALDRLKWHLVRRRLMPELLEVLRWEKDGGPQTTPPVRIRGRWYGDFPFRTDKRLAIPSSVYRLRGEPALTAHLEELRRDGDELRVSGFAYIEGIGAPKQGSQSIALTALRPGPLRRVRLRTLAVRLRTRATHRPDATAKSRQALADVSWSGFEATLDPRALKEGGSELYVTVRAGGVKRRRVRFALEGPRPFAAVDLPDKGDLAVCAAVTDNNGVVVDVRREWVRVDSVEEADGVVALAGECRLPENIKKLHLRRDGDSKTFAYPLERDGVRFTARVTLADLAGAGPAPPAEDEDALPTWRVLAGRSRPVRLDAALAEAAWGDYALVRTMQGDAAIVERGPRGVVDEAAWTRDGGLELAGALPDGGDWDELVLAHADRGHRHSFPLTVEGRRFRAALTPGRVESLAGLLPLRSGSWRLPALVAAPALLDALPLHTVIEGKPFTLGVKNGEMVINVLRDLGDDERGGYHQRRLRETVYAPRRRSAPQDAVVYMTYGGRTCSDGPRAIYEELVRRDAPVEHQWVVRDRRCVPPEGATVLREGGREYYEALAAARFVVSNDHFPDWFARRTDQTCLQLWHGTPLERLGLDMAGAKALTRFERRWDGQAGNWQHVVSPNPFSTPILERAFPIDGEIIEVGYPRVDPLSAPGRDERTARARAALGIPDGVRTILYAPTYRESAVDRRGRYRLDLRLDLDRLRRPDTVILFRRHPLIADPAPATPDGFVRDVSSHPDEIELLLAADVFVTDYSELMVDYANTGRPMLFFAYDLEAHERAVGGFYIDMAEAPGPLLRTSDAVVEALDDLDAVAAAHAERYAAFRSTFCALDDGGASARVVDHVFPAAAVASAADSAARGGE